MKNATNGNQEPFRIFMWLSALLTLLAYLPVVNNNFVNWDDPIFIQNNPHIHNFDPSSLHWIFMNFFAGYWAPIYWLSLALDYHLGHLEPWIYHLNNLVLHCLNTTLVFSITFKLLMLCKEKPNFPNENQNTPWLLSSAFGTALLFGIHPIHVESVAWATERKDLLCGFFFLSCLLTYLGYASQSEGKAWKYWSCFGLFILALLSKPMAVSLPFILILVDYWPLRRLYFKPKKVILEKIPFLIAAFLSSALTALYQYKVGNTLDLNILPMSFRIMNAFHSLIFYLIKMLVPANLTAFYPIFLKNTFSIEYFASALLVFLISIICFIYRNKYPYLIVGWLSYMVILAPVLGFLQSNSVAAADRYTYLPCLGPFMLFIAMLEKLFSRWKNAFLILLVGWSALLGYGTFHQISFWKDSIALWENILKVYPNNNVIVYNNMAASYEDAGRLHNALAEYNRAIATGVPLSNSHYGKGKILLKENLIDDSIQEFKTSIALDTSFCPPHSDLGMVYEQKGLHKEALDEIHEAIQLDPEYAPAYNNLGIIFRNQSRLEESMKAFQKARSLDPDNWTYLKSMISTYQQLGNYKQALALYRELSNQ